MRIQHVSGRLPALLLAMGLTVFAPAMPALAGDSAPTMPTASSDSCAADPSFAPGELAALGSLSLAVADETDPSKQPVTIRGWSPDRTGYVLAKPALVVPMGLEGEGRTIMVSVRWYDRAGASLDPNADGPAWLDDTVRTVVTVTGLTSRATRAYTVAADASLLPAGKPAGTCPVAVWRLYNPGLPQAAQHLYTSNAEEYNSLVANHGWRGEGVVFQAGGDPAGMPVYRVYNPYTSEHFLTSDKAEFEGLTGNGWKDDGIAWRIPADGDLPLYRLHNPVSHEHLYTVNAAEKDNLVDNAGWVLEGVQYKVHGK